MRLRLRGYLVATQHTLLDLRHGPVMWDATVAPILNSKPCSADAGITSGNFFLSEQISIAIHLKDEMRCRFNSTLSSQQETECFLFQENQGV